MPNWKLNNVQENVSLRLATFLVALLSLVFGVIWLGLSSWLARILIEWSHFEKHPEGYIYLLRFSLFLFMLIICFELLLCVALLVGLLKRLPDHLQMWYMGFMLCRVVRTPVAIFINKQMFYAFHRKYFWFIISEITIETLATLCFIYVVRRYFLKMTTETNYYQNLSYTQANMQAQALYSDNPNKASKKVAFENDINDYNDMDDTRPPQYGQLEKGDMTYPIESAPELPLVEIHEKQDSSLYPSLA